jgi:hypothetical protein
MSPGRCNRPASVTAATPSRFAQDEAATPRYNPHNSDRFSSTDFMQSAAGASCNISPVGRHPHKVLFVMQSGDRENSGVAKLGLAFAQSLVRGDYQAAHDILAIELRDDLQPSDLKTHYEQMTSYWTAPADKVEVSHVDPPWASWPGKEERDVGWVFLAIEPHPDDRSATLEGICVRVVDENGRYRITQIEWGRP